MFPKYDPKTELAMFFGAYLASDGLRFLWEAHRLLAGTCLHRWACKFADVLKELAVQF